jgi:hypothetical protein
LEKQKKTHILSNTPSGLESTSETKTNKRYRRKKLSTVLNSFNFYQKLKGYLPQQIFETLINKEELALAKYLRNE